MTKKLSIKFLLEIVFVILMVLPACYIKIGSLMLRVSVLFCIIFFAIYFSFSKNIFKDIKSFIQNRKSQFFLLWFISVIVVSIANVILVNYSLLHCIQMINFRLICLIFFPFFIGFTLNRYCTINEILKLFCIAISIVICVGFLDFIFANFGNSFLQNLLSHTITNNRTLLAGEDPNINQSFGMYRIYSVFDEPSYLAEFLCFNLPILYFLHSYKTKLFKNIYIDLFCHKYLFLFSWCIIIGAMSPIFLIVAILISVFYYFSNIKWNIKTVTNLSVVIIFMVLFIMALFKYDFSGTFLVRIQDSLNNMSSFDEFVKNNDSLGSRLVCYINTWILFLHHPLIGVGFGNLKDALNIQLILSPVTLTPLLKKIIISNNSAFAAAILWNSLAETGIFVTILLYKLFFDLINKLNKMAELFIFNNHMKNMCKAFGFSIFFIAILTIYDSRITDVFIWELLGVVAGMKMFIIKIRDNKYENY